MVKWKHRTEKHKGGLVLFRVKLMSMQTGSNRGHHLANYHCWHIEADPSCQWKRITPCPACPAICQRATRHAIQCAKDGGKRETAPWQSHLVNAADGTACWATCFANFWRTLRTLSMSLICLNVPFDRRHLIAALTSASWDKINLLNTEECLKQSLSRRWLPWVRIWAKALQHTSWLNDHPAICLWVPCEL